MSERQPPGTGQQSHQSGFPSNFQPILFEGFNGINTKTPRPGIRDNELAWIDGFMIVGPNNVRTLYDIGDAIWGDPIGIVWFGFGNIEDTRYCYILRRDGSMISINMNTLEAGAVMPAHTVSPVNSVFGFSQWGSQYVIFANDQTNGYWLWDNNNLFTAGTLGPLVTIVDSGQGYNSSPAVSIVTTGGGSGAAFDFTIQNQQVSQATVTNPGTGWGVDDFTAFYLTGGGSNDSAILACNVHPHSGGLAEAYVILPGSAYTGYAYAVVNGGGGHGATLSLGIQNGAITQVAIVTAGQGYTTTPGIEIFDPGIPNGPTGGSGGDIGVTISYGQVTGVGIMYGGTGYVSPPLLTILGDGVNATGIASVSGGQVVSIDMTNYGQGYTKAVAQISGGNNGAAITCQTMPFGVSGTTVEVYENHVWVSNGAATSNHPPRNRTIFSAPDSPTDFGDGGGAFNSTDSFLKVGIHSLKQANGFLYLIADSSTNYISNVQTNSSSSTTVPAIPITTFGNLNVDPQTGSSWPSSVQVFQRNVVFANTIGVYATYGGAIKKVSEPLDGFYSNGPIFGSSSNFSSAVAQIFGIPVYLLLLPITNPFSGKQENKLLIWDGTKWFVSSQSKNLTYITTLEFNSVLRAYGTDGTNIWPLFTNGSMGFKKVLQSKLFSNPGYFTTKIARSLNAVFNSYVVDGGLTISIDDEQALGTGNAIVITPPGGDVQWVNASDQIVTWQNDTMETVKWVGSNSSSGIFVTGPWPLGQQGRMIGITVQTRASDLAILSIMLNSSIWTPNV